MGLQWLQACH